MYREEINRLRKKKKRDNIKTDKEIHNFKKKFCLIRNLKLKIDN